jgi:hypothetical protein
LARGISESRDFGAEKFAQAAEIVMDSKKGHEGFIIKTPNFVLFVSFVVKISSQ